MATQVKALTARVDKMQGKQRASKDAEGESDYDSEKSESDYDSEASDLSSDKARGEQRREKSRGKTKAPYGNKAHSKASKCRRCGKTGHWANDCQKYRAKRRCPFKFPDGTRCEGDHAITMCWYNDPSTCPESAIPRVEAKLKRTSKAVSAHSTHYGGEESDEDNEDIAEYVQDLCRQ